MARIVAAQRITLQCQRVGPVVHHNALVILALLLQLHLVSLLAGVAVGKAAEILVILIVRTR